jgi:prepilin-type N-terminal cleavage/methylation domain-containing protein
MSNNGFEPRRGARPVFGKTAMWFRFCTRGNGASEQSSGRCVRTARAAFTLVEMLVVAVIISILLSLISVAVFKALRTARESAIATEAKGLATALRQQYAMDLPPADLRLDISGVDIASTPLYRYVQRNFARYDVTKLRDHLLAENINIEDYDPGYALVFWLVGFSGDPANPFRGHAQRMGLAAGSEPDLTKAYYSFDEERLILGHYLPKMPGDVESLYNHSDTDNNGIWDSGETFDGRNAFLYFDADTTYRGRSDGTGAGTVYYYYDFRPYRKTDGGPHYNNDTLQIVSSGLDKKLGYGTGPAPGWQSLEWNSANAGKRCFADADNITNFTTGTIEDHEEE